MHGRDLVDLGSDTVMHSNLTYSLAHDFFRFVS
jgi:hypothetical protein